MKLALFMFDYDKNSHINQIKHLCNENNSFKYYIYVCQFFKGCPQTLLTIFVYDIFSCITIYNIISISFALNNIPLIPSHTHTYMLLVNKFHTTTMHNAAVIDCFCNGNGDLQLQGLIMNPNTRKPTLSKLNCLYFLN